MDYIKGKVAVVTGGSRGIGRSICLMLADAGAKVTFNYLSGAKEASALTDEIKSKGGTCLAAQVDVTDAKAVAAWVNQVKSELGGLDIIINNAGIVRDKPLMMMTSEDWHKVIDTNLNGMYNVTRACIVTLMKQKAGHIINISSVSGIMGLPGQANYSASKGAMNAFTKALAKEVAAYGVRVNAIAPGFIETEILSHLDEEQREAILKKIPLGRIGVPEDVSACVKFLLSKAAAYMTGQVIQVDGGLAIH